MDYEYRSMFSVSQLAFSSYAIFIDRSDEDLKREREREREMLAN